MHTRSSATTSGTAGRPATRAARPVLRLATLAALTVLVALAGLAGVIWPAAGAPPVAHAQWTTYCEVTEWLPTMESTIAECDDHRSVIEPGPMDDECNLYGAVFTWEHCDGESPPPDGELVIVLDGDPFDPDRHIKTYQVTGGVFDTGCGLVDRPLGATFVPHSGEEVVGHVRLEPYCCTCEKVPPPTCPWPPCPTPEPTGYPTAVH